MCGRKNVLPVDLVFGSHIVVVEALHPVNSQRLDRVRCGRHRASRRGVHIIMIVATDKHRQQCWHTCSCCYKFFSVNRVKRLSFASWWKGVLHGRSSNTKQHITRYAPNIRGRGCLVLCPHTQNVRARTFFLKKISLKSACCCGLFVTNVPDLHTSSYLYELVPVRARLYGLT